MHIPPLKMQDAAQGFRATQPNTGMLALASTWDEGVISLVAAAIATEFKGKGANVILGPSVNVHRGALNGRNFEYISGEAGFVGMASATWMTAQDQGIMAVAKHFAFNEQETNRMSMDAKASERTGMELYFSPFRGAVAAGVGAFMCAYNKAGGWGENMALGFPKVTLAELWVGRYGFADLRFGLRGSVAWMLVRSRWP
eukprot:Skav225925  [mRNA]  locus=scaffold1500:291021:294655:- [translate_table: standard]